MPKIIALDTWLQTPAGEYVKGWEQTRLNELTTDIFGFHAVQIGLPQIDALQASRMPNKWLTDTHIPSELEGAKHIVVSHDFTELPFATQSLDLVILPHVLEFAAEPHQILREVERVLIPEGRVIISGFNPASLWGLRQAAGRVTGRNFLPKEGEFIALHRLKDWLKLLDMEVDRDHFGCYAPPYQKEAWLNRFNFMEKAGQHWWPYLGAVYMTQAIKRVKGMRLIGPAWAKHPGKLPKAVPATNKHHRGHHRKTNGQD